MAVDEKVCTDCGEMKPAPAFYRDPAQRSGLRSYCKKCQRVRNLRTYHDGASRIRSIQEPCAVCGNDDLRVIEFHHLDPSQKRFQIAGSGRRSMPTIMAEAAKCVCLCANCHRLFHVHDAEVVAAVDRYKATVRP